MHATLREIRKTPEGILKAQKSVEKFISEYNIPRRAVFTGCGSSYHLAKALAMITNLLDGFAIEVPASELLYNKKAYPLINPEILIAISRSGETTEVLMAAEKSSIPVIGVTAYKSTLSKISARPLIIPVKEKSVVMTHSFTSFLFAFEQIIRKSHDREVADVRHIHDALKKLLKDEAFFKEVVERFDFQNIFFLGSGLLYPIALEGMLKMKEMALLWSEAHQTFEVRHGFKSVIDSRTLVVMLVEKCHEWYRRLIKELRNQGAKIIVIGTCDKLGADYVFQLPELGYLDLLPLYLPPIQLLSYYKAISCGLDPDKPRFLDKIVRW